MRHLLFVTLGALAFLVGCDSGSGEDTGGASAAPKDCDAVSGNICTWAGTGEAGFNGDGYHRLESRFYYPMDVEFSPYGKPTVNDWNNHKIRIVEDDESFRTVMGTDFLGDGPPDVSDMTEPGAPGTEVNLNHPTDSVYWPDGIMLSSSWHTHKLRNWDPATGLVMVVLGSGPGFEPATDEFTPQDARTTQLNQPVNAILDDAGNVYTIDMRNERIRFWDVANDTIQTVVGTGEKCVGGPGECGDGGPGIEAALNVPKSENPEPGGALVWGPGGQTQLYWLDTENHRIRVYDLTTGLVDSVAGTGVAGYADGAFEAAQFNYPKDMEIVDDVIYVADDLNHTVRAVNLTTRQVTTVAGTGMVGFTGDDGPALEAQLNRPMGIGVGLDGHLYVSDTHNHRIRVIYQ